MFQLESEVSLKVLKMNEIWLLVWPEGHADVV